MSDIYIPIEKKEIIAGNLYDKYNTVNPLARFFMNKFLDDLDALLRTCSQVKNILEVGCGEGHLTNHIRTEVGIDNIEALDRSNNILHIAHLSYPSISFVTGSIYHLPYPNHSKDLVIACELLEHLKEPNKALSEICRVAKKYIILSVPREPLWSLCNICRGHYLNRLGNTPPHLQKWTKRQFKTFVTHYFNIIRIRNPFPWTMIMGTIIKENDKQ